MAMSLLITIFYIFLSEPIAKPVAARPEPPAEKAAKLQSPQREIENVRNEIDSPKATKSVPVASATPHTSPPRSTTIAARPNPSPESETLVIESSHPGEGTIHVKIPDKRLVPLVLRSDASAKLPAPVQQALQNISDEYADNIIAATESSSLQGTNSGLSNPQGASSDASIAQGNASASSTLDETTGTGETTSPAASVPAAAVIPDSALKTARDIADQRYRAFFGDAAYNQAGLQRALEATSQTPPE